MSSRQRTFSDMSVAESCVALRTNSLTIYAPCTTLIEAGKISKEEVDDLYLGVLQRYSQVTEKNISKVVIYLCDTMKRKKHIVNNDKRLIIIEIVTRCVDESHTHSIKKNYTQFYRPLLRDVFPDMIDQLLHTQSRKKACVIL